MHNNLWELMWWGEGRWDWNTLYNLPVHWRKFWTVKMNKILEAKLDTAETEANKKNNTKPDIAKPPF